MCVCVGGVTLGFQTSYCKLILCPYHPPKTPKQPCLTQGKGPPRVESGKREGRGQGLVSPEQPGIPEESPLAQTKEGEAVEGSWVVQPG